MLLMRKGTSEQRDVVKYSKEAHSKIGEFRKRVDMARGALRGGKANTSWDDTDKASSKASSKTKK